MQLNYIHKIPYQICYAYVSKLLEWYGSINYLQKWIAKTNKSAMAYNASLLALILLRIEANCDNGKLE